MLDLSKQEPHGTRSFLSLPRIQNQWVLFMVVLFHFYVHQTHSLAGSGSSCGCVSDGEVFGKWEEITDYEYGDINNNPYPDLPLDLGTEIVFDCQYDAAEGWWVISKIRYVWWSNDSGLKCGDAGTRAPDTSPVWDPGQGQPEGPDPGAASGAGCAGCSGASGVVMTTDTSKLNMTATIGLGRNADGAPLGSINFTKNIGAGGGMGNFSESDFRVVGYNGYSGGPLPQGASATISSDQVDVQITRTTSGGATTLVFEAVPRIARFPRVLHTFTSITDSGYPGTGLKYIRSTENGKTETWKYFGEVISSGANAVFQWKEIKPDQSVIEMTAITGFYENSPGKWAGTRTETVTYGYPASSLEFSKTEDREFRITSNGQYVYPYRATETRGAAGDGQIVRSTMMGVLVRLYHDTTEAYTKWEVNHDGSWVMRKLGNLSDQTVLYEVRPWLDGPDLGFSLNTDANRQAFFEALFAAVEAGNADVLSKCVKTSNAFVPAGYVSLDEARKETIGAVRLSASYKQVTPTQTPDDALELSGALPIGFGGSPGLRIVADREDRRDGSGMHYSTSFTYRRADTIGSAAEVYAVVDPRGIAKGYYREPHPTIPSATVITENVVQFDPVTRNVLRFHPMENIAVEDERGRVVARQQKLYYGSLDPQLVSTSALTYDDYGGLETETQDDRTIFSASTTTSGVMTTRSETDAKGITRTRQERDDGRIDNEIKSGIAASTGVAAQPELKTQFTYAKTGNTLAETTTTLSGAENAGIVSSRTTDAIGRMITATDEGGRTTTTQYNEATRTTIETLPGNLVRTTTTYRDGRVKTIRTMSGVTVVDQEYHAYAVNDGANDGALAGLPHGSITETVFLNDDGTGETRSPRWSMVTTNSLGWVMREEKPGPGKDENNNPIPLVKIHHYDAGGQKLRAETTGMADTLYQTDLLGLYSLTALDTNDDGEIGNDEPREQTNVLYEPFEGGWAQRTIVQPMVPPGGDSQVVATQVVRKLGMGPEDVTETQYNDGRFVRTSTAINRAAKTVTRTTQTRKSSGVLMTSTDETSVNGLVVSATLPGVTGNPIVYAHDKYGRVSGVTDPRSGASSWTLNNDGNKLTSTDASNVTTTYGYHAADTPQAGSLKSVSVGTARTYYMFDPVARTSYQWGNAVTPVKYVYNAHGEMTEMYTYPNHADFASGPALPVAAFAGGGRKTTWSRDDGSGAVTGKTYGLDLTGTEYGYYPSGLLESRTWARSSGGQRVKTTYTYQPDGTGRLAGISYNDGTPGVSYTGYAADGHLTGMTDAAGSHVLGIGPGGTNDAVTGGLLGGFKVQKFAVSAFGGGARLIAWMNNVQFHAVEHRGNHWPRVDGVESGTANTSGMAEVRHRFNYMYRTIDGQLDYVSAQDEQNRLVFANGGTRPTGERTLKRKWTYEAATGRPASLRWYKEETRGGAASTLTTTAGWKYPLYDGRGRKKRIEPFDTDRALPAWKYDYDHAGEVTGAERVNLLVGGGESAPIASQTRGYAYDGVGNRETATQGAGTEARTTGYHSNEHNQYAESGAVPAIAHHRYVEITGQAATGAVVQVKVNGEIGIPISGSNTDGWGTGEPGSYRREVQITGDNAQWLDVEISASVNGGTPVVKRGWVYAPPASETQVHDEDGNLIEDARWTYEWDAENRMSAAEEKALAYWPVTLTPPVRKRLEFAYDARHRRIQKVVRHAGLQPGAWSAPVKDTRFVYDDWNLIAELDALNSMRATRTYTWGPDLSGTLQGAGGVGGLLAVTHQGTSYYVCSDANGNVAALYATNGLQGGKVVARYDYDPFGNRITDTGPGVELCPFGFSTKYRDEETGMLYYGRRYLKTVYGRWLNRDPIEEQGGVNLYEFVGNDPINRFDVLGMWETAVHHEILTDWLADPKYANYKWRCCTFSVIDLLAAGSDEVDGVDGISVNNFFSAQSSSNAYQHAMRSYNESVASASQKYANFLSQNIATAKRMANLARKSPSSGDSLACFEMSQAMRFLGFAFHAFSDSLSPSHMGFQIWYGPIDGTGGLGASNYSVYLLGHHNRETPDVYHSQEPAVVGAVKTMFQSILDDILRN